MIDMRSLAVVSLVLLAATCGPDPNARLPSFVASSGGGENGTGGTSDSGGAGGASGQTGSGGRGTGGAVGTGGRSGSGGAVATGGSAGSTRRDAGARDSGGSGGRGDGGSIGSDGRIGGRSGSGGDTGGRREDASTTRDTPISVPDASATCVGQVVSNDYACGSATSCADCKDNNNNPRTDGCKKAIDCLAKSGCDSNCQKNCLNLAGDQYGIACVTALQTAACSGSGCGTTTPPNRGG